MKLFNYKVIREDGHQRTEYERAGCGENFLEAILDDCKWEITTKKNSFLHAYIVENYSKKYKCKQEDIEIKFNENKIRIEVYKNGELVEFKKFEKVGEREY